MPRYKSALELQINFTNTFKKTANNLLKTDILNICDSFILPLQLQEIYKLHIINKSQIMNFTNTFKKELTTC